MIKDDRLPPYTAEVKKEWSSTSILTCLNGAPTYSIILRYAICGTPYLVRV